MDDLDIEQFRIKSEIKMEPTRSGSLKKHYPPGEKFLRGPIPWDWLCIATRLPGKAIHVAIAIWFLRYVKKSLTIRLSSKLLRELGVHRKAGYRGRKALAEAGLISFTQASGRCPVVTILEAPKFKCNGNGKESDDMGGTT